MSERLLTGMADLYGPGEYNPFCMSNLEHDVWTPEILVLVDMHNCGVECGPDENYDGFRWTPKYPVLRFSPHRGLPRSPRLLTSVADLYPDGYDSFLLSPEYETFRPPMLAFVLDHMCSTNPCYAHSEAYQWDSRMPVMRFGAAPAPVPA